MTAYAKDRLDLERDLETLLETGEIDDRQFDEAREFLAELDRDARDL